MYDEEEEEDYNNNDDYYEYGDGFKKGFPDRLNFVSACCCSFVQVVRMRIAIVKIMIMIMMVMMKVMMKVMMVLLHPSVLPQIENASGCNKCTALFLFI